MQYLMLEAIIFISHFFASCNWVKPCILITPELLRILKIYFYAPSVHWTQRKYKTSFCVLTKFPNNIPVPVPKCLN